MGKNYFELLGPSAYRVFGRFIDPALRGVFAPLEEDIKKIGLKLTIEEYISLAIATSVFTFVPSNVLFTLLFTIIFKRNLIAGLIMGFVSSIFFSLLILFLFYIYPKNVIMSRRKKIDATLPFATFYLLTIAGSGATVTSMFRLLATMDEYKTLAQEARRIVYDVENLGYNIGDALKNAADRSVSDQFRDLLWGIRSTMLVGGDLQTYIREKCNIYLQEYKRYLVKFGNQLNLFVEMYTTLILVGSIFFVILTTILGLMMESLFIPFIQFGVIFFLLPLSTLGFIVIFKSLSLEG